MKWHEVKAAGDALAMCIYGEWVTGNIEYDVAQAWEKLTGAFGGSFHRWAPGDFCGCSHMHLRDCPAVLSWFHGPTPTDPDPAKMWCYRCGQQVYATGNSYTCTGCDKEE